MSEKFKYYKFQNTVNPFGILFHPLAIQQIIRRAIHQDFFTESDLFFYNERWHCYEIHSDLSAANKESLLQKLNQLLVDFKSQITDATHLLITYGTSWVYREKASNMIVANCHKVPQSQFEKELVSIAKIQTSIQETIALIRSVNADCSIVLTVSPVRHIKDGFVENQRSKAQLIAAIHEQLKTDNYFPSYEIMMDELRDYRFYAEDMLHPNSIAIDYIWERFVESAVSEDSLSIMEEVNTIQKGVAHKPFHPDSHSYQQFLKQLQAKITHLQKRYPELLF